MVKEGMVCMYVYAYVQGAGGTMGEGPRESNKGRRTSGRGTTRRCGADRGGDEAQNGSSPDRYSIELLKEAQPPRSGKATPTYRCVREFVSS